MEAWLAELEMDIGQDGVLFNNYQPQQSTAMETPFDEHWEDFPYPLSAGESNTSSPQLDFDYNNFIEHLSPPDNYAISNDNLNTNNSDEISILNTSTQLNREIGAREVKMKQHGQDALQSSGSNVEVEAQDNVQKISNNKTDATNKPSGSGGAKRKREPSQVQDHIMAERRRRELLSQRFIALSAIVPGLKKTDKTSVLGESIKYMKQLQEKVKVLEEVAAKRTVESVLVIRKSQLVIDDDGVDDNNSSCTVEETAISGTAVDHDANDSLPEIELKVSDKSFLLRIYCENRKGILAKLFAEIEKHDLSILNTSIIPFGSLALDINIVAQKENEFSTSVKDLVRSVRSALLLSSHGCHQRSKGH